MPIKSFLELANMDLKGHLSKKPVFKRNKATNQYDKVGELDYLNWADCLELLYQNGAETVRFGNIRSAMDHPLFLANNSLPFVRVFVAVDGDSRDLDFPVIDGANDVSMEKITQSDIHNATQRGFVKCVAVNWGLGLSLWQKEEKPNEQGRTPADNLEYHNIMMIKKRVEIFITGKLKGGMSMEDILSCINLSQAQYNKIMQYFDGIAALETRLSKL